MSLVSPEFALFVALAALVTHTASQRYRPAFLCLLSLAFCALNSVPAAAALCVATAGAFLMARWIERCGNDRCRRLLLGTGIAVLLAHLILIKVLPHWTAARESGWAAAMLAGFGASYYTLKLIGYLIDVYWQRYPAWSTPARFGMFATFFPLLPAGPIQRASEFQLETDSGRLAALATQGLRRVLFGLAKKLLVADPLGGVVDYIAASQPAHTNLLWVMAYLFPLQLYVDFSALTDMGIGTAAIFGVRAPENFAFPFFAPSISEFWRRWHMSLTRWLGDYVFAPLRMATRTLGTAGLAISIVINMALIGMWHAVSFGWLLFGLINAAFLLGDVLTVRHRRRLYKHNARAAQVTAVAGPVLVFHAIALSLVCFRAQTLPDIGYFFGNLLSGFSEPVTALRQLFFSYGRGRCAYAFGALCAFVLVEAILYLRTRGSALLSGIPRFDEWPRTLRWSAYYLALLGIAVVGQQSSRFIYVQF